MNDDNLPLLDAHDIVDEVFFTAAVKFSMISGWTLAVLLSVGGSLLADRILSLEARLDEQGIPDHHVDALPLLLDPVLVEDRRYVDDRAYVEDLLGTDDAEMMALVELTSDARVWRIVQAMNVLATQEDCADCTIGGLTKRWGGTPSLMAEAIVKASDRHGIDPLILVDFAYKETRFDPRAKGDTDRGDLVMSCGPTQVRVDFPQRPSCEQLQDVEFAFDWSAKHIAQMQTINGRLRLVGWNGAPSAELATWRNVDYMRREVGP